MVWTIISSVIRCNHPKVWKQLCLTVLIIVAFSTICSGSSAKKTHGSPEGGGNATNHTSPEEGIKLVGWRMDHLLPYVTFTVFVTMLALFKLIYHWIPYLDSYVPESCLLIGLGCIFGGFLKLVPSTTEWWKLSPDLFFLLLLPPIILESSFHLYNRVFAVNIIPVLLFAIIGTLLNFLMIGGGIYALDKAGALGSPELQITLLHGLLFSSLIVAVDPVAVLAIFEDIGVNESLYYIVFGESLLNDAITIVLYTTIQTLLLLRREVVFKDVALGIASFFTVSFGGCIIGMIMGILCCLVTRISHFARKMEPLIIFTFGYFAYLAGDVVAWSGIMASVGCGVIQAAYAFHNISEKSRLAVHRLTTLIASVSEAIIFLFLGIELVVPSMESHQWHTGFALWALFLCLVSRTLVTLLLSALSNYANLSRHTISITEQFILSYGGLRGAVAFSLAALIEERAMVNIGLSKSLILTTTLFIILFTVIIQGLTMKPLVKLLKIKLKDAESRLSLINSANTCIMRHVLAGMESIIGVKGFHHGHEMIDRIDDNYIRPFLQRNPKKHDDRILEVLHRIDTEIHLASSAQTSNTEKHMERLPHLIALKLNRDRTALLLNENEESQHNGEATVKSLLLKEMVDELKHDTDSSDSDDSQTNVRHIRRRRTFRETDVEPDESKIYKLFESTNPESIVTKMQPHDDDFHSFAKATKLLLAKNRFLSLKNTPTDSRSRVMSSPPDVSGIQSKSSNPPPSLENVTAMLFSSTAPKTKVDPLNPSVTVKFDAGEDDEDETIT